MLKLSRRAIGSLSSQYRSILKKCFLLNICMGSVLFSLNANAAGDAMDSSVFNTPNYGNPLDAMGTSINGDTSAVSKLYVNGSYTAGIYSNGASNYSWLLNMGTVQIGYKYDSSTGAIVEDNSRAQISNRHNMDAYILYNGGSVVSNGNTAGDDAILKVVNTDFSNNSASCFGGACYYQDDSWGTVGGVIANYSTTEATIDNSTFSNNYVMSDETARGGAIFNGSPNTGQGILSSSNNTYTNNHAGNIDFAGLDTNVKNAWGGTSASNIASGGAVYNTGKYTTNNDKYIGNFAIGDNAYGGAIHNDTVSFNQTNGGQLILEGKIEFKDNYAQSNIASGGSAYGGALYNDKFVTTSSDAVITYENNYVSAQNNAQGGALYNDTEGVMDVHGSFTGNHADVSAGSSTSGALGGAFANYGSAVNKATYTQNYTNSTGTTQSISAGGAIANFGTLSSDSKSFSANKAESNVGSALGGAIMNSKDYTSSRDTYSNNTTESSSTASETNKAFGGAIYNGNVSEITSQIAKLDILAGAEFINNKADAAFSSGGAILNHSSGNLSIDGTTQEIKFSGNQALGGSLMSAGGAIGNMGTLDITGASFTSNISDGSNAVGGGLANMIENMATSNIKSSLFDGNIVKTKIAGYGGAIYNANVNVQTKIIDTSFKNNQIQVTENGTSNNAYGGAIYNNGANSSISLLKISNQSSDVIFENNKIVVTSNNGTTTKNYFGGAIYNGSTGQLNIESIVDNKSIVFNNNEALNGGAIYNSANGQSVALGTSSITSYLTLKSAGGDIEFNSNKAAENGGAIYNSSTSTGTLTLTANNSSSLKFASNSAKNGGAIYNTDESTVLLQLGNNSAISFSSNNVSNNGGAIYNEKANIQIENLTTAQTSELLFASNKAQKGAAIYNTSDANISVTLEDNNSLMFNNNEALSNQGGAIYNEANAGVNIELKDKAKLIFNTSTDDVYNLGEVTISGDSPNPVVNTMKGAVISNIRPKSISPSLTQVVLNSTFGGNGKYNISNTQLNLGSSGYIDYEPTMNFSNNTINMAGGSYINLDTTDTLLNNDFDISRGAKLTYRATTSSSNIVLANNVINTGLIDLGDGVTSKIEINTLTSNDGTIRIDVDNPSYTADVITINNRIYGTTNVVFDNQNTLTMDGQKIYFAQTQAEQSLSEYKFNTFVVNNLYEINVGYEQNGLVYDWFLYRDITALSPEVIAYIDLPRSAIEQTRSIMLDISRTNKGRCDCYSDMCYNRYCRYTSDDHKARIWAKPVFRIGSFDKPIETDVTVYGIDFGFDYQPTHSDMFGIFGSYRKGKYENEGKGEKYFSNQGSELDISSAIAGIYYRKYFGNLYMNGVVYGGQQDVDVKADNSVTASTKGLNIGAQAEIGYDIRTTRRSVLTPSIKATYDYIKFDDLTDSTEKEVGFDDIHDIELEAGIKFEYQFNNERQLPTTGYIKPSIIQTLSSGGKVTVASKEFEETIEDDTLGRIEIGADAELIENFSVGAFGNYTFGSEYNAWGVGGNIKYVW